VAAVVDLMSNAWSGERAASGPMGPGSLGWGMRADLKKPQQLLGPDPVDYSNWRDPRVGWGVVFPDAMKADPPDKATGAKAPEAVRELLKARPGSPLLYYSTEPGMRERLRRYAPGGAAADLRFSGARGTGINAIPYYLLIIASPLEIPWNAQYRMQTDAYVGRLDLDEAGLERYIDALLGEWAGAPCQRSKPLVWSVDHHIKDISTLMRKTIAEPFAKRLTDDPAHEFDMAQGMITDGAARHDVLIDALDKRKPAFVMSTSHGATFPVNDEKAMRAQLGLPIDVGGAVLDVGALARNWDGYGAIWYAHACCSAGSDSSSIFSGLVGDSDLADTLNGIAKVDACSAPLPRELLGGKRPIRAFIGHVEPTFNWTLRDKDTGQVMTQRIIDSLYGQLHLATRPPLGFSMQPYFRAVGGLMQDYAAAMDDVVAMAAGAQERARTARLMAYDSLATVLLGDPTVQLSA